MVTLMDIMWSAIYNVSEMDYPEDLTKEEKDELKKKRTLEEYNRLKKVFGYR